MKNIFLSIIALIILVSCDKGYTAISYIENKTDNLIICDYYRGDTISESFRIQADSTIEIYTLYDAGNPSFIQYLEADKIRIEGYKDTIIWFYPFEESDFKSMYVRDNWEKSKDGDDIYISTYVFE